MLVKATVTVFQRTSEVMDFTKMSSTQQQTGLLPPEMDGRSCSFDSRIELLDFSRNFSAPIQLFILVYKIKRSQVLSKNQKDIFEEPDI